jgi:ABC-type Fe3+-hydroxamate transport system substrate-binding protein
VSKDDEVSRDELIADLQQFQDNIKDAVSDKSNQLKALVGGASTLGMISSFLLGRKSGKRRNTESREKSDE